MRLAATAAELLSRRLGLSPELLGDGAIERALDLVFPKARLAADESTAARLLEDEGEEWHMLVDEVIVPETWFFRHSEAFRFLATYVREKTGPDNLSRSFRVLCIPCASGEEAYSVVMTLLDAGLEASRIQVDAADVSRRLVERAKLAVYGKMSFREQFDRLHEKYFLPCDEGWRVREEVTRFVRFEEGNLLALSLFSQRAPYDAVFCRNALIYLDASARHKVVRQLRELLDDGGLLFTGPSELTHFCEAGYVPVDYPQAFACVMRKSTPVRSSGPSPTKTISAPTVQRVTMSHVPPPVASRSKARSSTPNATPSFEQVEQLADRGDLNAAAALCEDMLKGGVQDPRVYALLGVISESRGNVESAEEFFRKALFLSPHHYESLMHMSVLCERRGDVNGSRLYRTRAGRALNRSEKKEVLKGL